MYSIQSHYTGTSCDGTPYSVTALENSTCTSQMDTCTAYEGNSSTITADMVSTECTNDYMTAMRQKFGDSPYVIQITYQEENCSSFSIGYGFPASGNCEGSFNESESYYVIARLNSSGSSSIEYFSANPCLSDSWYMTQSANQETLKKHLCDANYFKWYSSNDANSSEGFTLPISSLVGIGFALLVLLLIGLVFVFYRRRLNAKRVERQHKWPAGPSEGIVDLNQVMVPGQTGLWNDDVITAKRISRTKVVLKTLISRGAYGEVHRGYVT